MLLDQFDAKFSAYRSALRSELHQLIDTVAVYQQLQECKIEYLEELNTAPGFFAVVESALVTKMVLWASKLLDESGEKGFFGFLNFADRYAKFLQPGYLKRRRGLDDDHWVLERRYLVTSQLVNSHKQQLTQLMLLAVIKDHRDKYQAHFDNQYFFDAAKLFQEKPILYADLHGACDLMSEIIDEYSSAFDGSTYSWSAGPVETLPVLLERVRWGVETLAQPEDL